MRIVAGIWGGRRLQAPAGRATRPTAERVREAIFAMLAARARIEGARVLDAFAGSVAMALEALSRGAAQAICWDIALPARRTLAANVTALEAAALVTIAAVDATRPPSADTPCDLIFLDPPYRADLVPRALEALARTGWVAGDALAVIEAEARALPALPPGWRIEAQRRFGDTAVLLAGPEGSPSS